MISHTPSRLPLTILIILLLALISSSTSLAQSSSTTTTATGTSSSSPATTTADPNSTTTTATAVGNSTTSPTTSSANGTTTPNVTITVSPATTTSTPVVLTTTTSSSAPVGLGPVDIRPIRNVTCPFSRWQGDPRYCYECRWCPFRQSTCCEMEDEIAVLKSVNVSGSSDWDCFITIVHFQQCGRCDPRSLSFLMNKTLNYVWDPRGVSIRPCKQACKYIYKQCKDAKTLSGENVVPAGLGEVEFCSDYPELSTPDVPCFESAGSVSYVAAALLLVLTVIGMLLF